MGRAPLVALALPAELAEEYIATLAGKAAGTVDAYGRILRQLTQWIAARPGNGECFRPEAFTRTALETYLSQLEAEGYSISHRARVKAVAGGFARKAAKLKPRRLSGQHESLAVTSPRPAEGRE